MFLFSDAFLESNGWRKLCCQIVFERSERTKIAFNFEKERRATSASPATDTASFFMKCVTQTAVNSAVDVGQVVEPRITSISQLFVI